MSLTFFPYLDNYFLKHENEHETWNTHEWSASGADP